MPLIVPATSGARSWSAEAARASLEAEEVAVVVIFVTVAACVAAALLGRAVSTAVLRVRGWYRGSVQGSAIELAALAALVGGVLGELYTRTHP